MALATARMRFYHSFPKMRNSIAPRPAYGLVACPMILMGLRWGGATPHDTDHNHGGEVLVPDGITIGAFCSNDAIRVRAMTVSSGSVALERSLAFV